MIGIETNVLVRYLAQDEPSQARRATRLIERLGTEEPGFISLVVLVEVWWVIRRAYGVERGEAAGIVRQLLATRELHVQDADVVRQALRDVGAGADLPDAIVRHLDAQAGCSYTVTFDRQAAKRTGMRLLTASR